MMTNMRYDGKTRLKSKRTLYMPPQYNAKEFALFDASEISKTVSAVETKYEAARIK